jgi:glycyl-tRNA synthetase
MNNNNNFTLKTISDFAKRKGLVYSGSEIYGGLANTWDFGPAGLLLRNNIKNLWRQHFMYERTDIVEIETGLFMNQKVWEASGHVGGFADCLIDDKTTKHRFRVDHLIEDQHNVDVEGWTPERITAFVREKGLINPNTKKQGDWTDARYMNLMFETNRDKLSNSVNILEGLISRFENGTLTLKQEDLKTLQNKLEAQEMGRIYLRPETAQGLFVQFKNVMMTERKKLPFGIGQVGKAFRNEITPGNFIFRIVELEQMEIEYFIKPPTTLEDWNTPFEELLEAQRTLYVDKLGLSNSNLRVKEHSSEKLSHYSKRTCDWEYQYPIGYSELSGLAYRTDFDLAQHSKFSGTDLSYLDPETNQKFIPHCIEPSVGLDRLCLAVMCENYSEEVLENGETRAMMKFNFAVAPYKIAILPLMKKNGMSEKAFGIYQKLRATGVSCQFDEAGSIGKRYRRQDENGTPWCVCIDFDTLENDTVTIRHRDTMQSQRIEISEIKDWLNAEKFGK